MTQDNDQKARNWAMLCHLCAIAWIPLALLLGVFSIPLPIPFLNILGPLIIWLSKRHQYPLVDTHGKEALNFQISLTIYSVIFTIVFVFLIAVTCGIGYSTNSSISQSPLMQIGIVIGGAFVVLSLVVGIIQLILVIFAAIKAKKGEFYHYPYTLRFLR